ncbi:hypothetical protein [Dehalobacter sp.]|uniref:hypothetical protein n=1 Tax=Dehalobacter sp. TaxID=1962289 RepID=UPI002590D441|nr:hypothetical protein [Dehalobacter sp.]MDJ0306750.1 hypothetical protein [Dehalobacter sp.]
MVTIEEYLEEVLYDFKKYIKRKPCLCDLKSVNFNSGLIPDYSIIPIQQLYLLRYAFAYAFEYKRMYLSLLDRKNFPNEISVLSLGCGTIVDYWSLLQALIETGQRKCVVTYVGSDLIDWEYKFLARKKDNVWLYQQNGADWVNESPSLGFDVYMFPKSISEFSHRDFEIICENFQNKEITKDNFHLLISLRVDQFSMERDISRTSQLMSAIQRNGYHTEDRYNVFTSFKDETKGIRYYDGDFVFPDDAIEIIKILNQSCKNYIDNGENCDTDCATLLTRWPVLKPTTIRYQIISFERG